MLQSLVPLSALCLLVLTTVVTLRLHYEAYQRDNCRKVQVGVREGASLSTLAHTTIDTTHDFQDEFFAPVLESYRDAARQSLALPQPLRFRCGRVPNVVMYVDDMFVKPGWYDEHMLDITEGRCAQPCNVTLEISQIHTADAVLVHLLSIGSREKLLEDLGARDLTQPWIMFEPESPFKGNALYHNNYTTLNGLFNRTMHYRLDSDIRLLHGFVVRRGRDSSVLPPTWRRPPQLQDTKNITTRYLAVAFVSNCNDHSGRMTYIRALQQHAEVHVVGKCGTIKCGHSLYTHHAYRTDLDSCLRVAGKSYLFYLAFENALCEDYVTEKLYNLMYYPIVPVVLGAADYTKLLPPQSYINAGDYRPQDLAKRLRYLADHPKEYHVYLEWRQYYQPSTVGGARVLCDLCTRLYDSSFYRHNVIEDFYDWYVTKARCKDAKRTAQNITDIPKKG